jgi:hypothetical protein
VRKKGGKGRRVRWKGVDLGDEEGGNGGKKESGKGRGG